MYTNEERNRFSIKNIVLVFLFIALIVFLLVWLFPMKSDVKKLESSLKDANTSSKATGEINLTVLYDRIFNENIIAMKDAAKSYYTLERLPQKVDDKVKMTLQQMLDAKIILPFVDKNGDACDTKASYVEITKYDTEYLMKVNLKCGSEENYLLVHMGCYDYCVGTAICESNKVDVKAPTVYKKVTPPTNNSIVKTSPSCSLQITSGAKGQGNYYVGTVTVGFASKVAGSNATLTGFGLDVNTSYNGKNAYSISGVGTHTIYGYVKNSFGNTSKCSINVTIGKDPEAVKYYEYTKTTTTKGTCTYGDWSDWSKTEIKPTSTLEVKRGTFQQRYLIGYNTTTVDDITKPIWKDVTAVIGSTTVTTCAAYTYTGTITYSSGWTYVGLVKTTSTPTSTDTVKYEYEGTYNWTCDNNCTAGTVYVYKMYKKSVASSSTGNYTCSKWNTDTTVYTATKSVVTGYEKKTEKTPVYETKTYYKWASRTKSCTQDKTTTSKVCSTKDNTSLINNGYTMTSTTCSTPNA